MKIFGSWKELVSLVFRKDGREVTLRPNQSTTYTADRDVQIPPGDTAHVLTSATSTQTLTNKTLDGDNNTVQNLALTSIKTALADADKVFLRDNAGAPVSSTISNIHVSPSAGIAYSKLSVPDNSIPEAKLTTVLVDANKVLRRDAAGVPVSGNTIPNSSALLTTDAAQVVTSKDIDGGTASNTNRVTLPKNILANLNALTRKEATVLYATDTKKLYLDDGSNLIPAGSSSGSGEINAVLNPSDANAGWTGSGSFTVTSLATGSPLDPIIPSGIRITATSSSGESSTSGGGYTIATMPESLYNKKLKLEFYFKTPISTDWAVSIYAGATRIPLSSDVAGVSKLPRNLTNKFVAYFDAKDDVTYSIRWTRVALSGTTSLDLTNVIVGPGIQANSAIVGQLVPWTPSVTISLNATWSGNYRQVGQFVEYFAEAAWSGGTNGGPIDISLPSGHVISSTNFVGPFSTLSIISSSGAIYNGGSAVHRISANVLDGTTIRVGHVYTLLDQMTNTDSNNPITIGAGTTLRIEFKLPIVAFEGAGTINVNTPDVEYIYNTNTTDTDNSTSFGYGAEGGQFGPYTALRYQRCRSAYPIGPTDRKELQFTGDGGLTWEPYEQGANISPRTEQNGVQYGAFIAQVNATDVDVYFGQYPRTTGATYGSAGQTWVTAGLANTSTFKWRLAIHRGPSPVGFSTATKDRVGLVSREIITTEQDIAGPFTWTGTAPTINTAKCMYHQVGKTVTVSMLIGLSPSGVNNTQVSFPFPSYLPTPKQFTTSVDLTWIAIGDGSLLLGPASPIEGGGAGILRDTGGSLLFVIYSKDATPVNASTVNATITYICE